MAQMNRPNMVISINVGMKKEKVKTCLNFNKSMTFPSNLFIPQGNFIIFYRALPSFHSCNSLLCPIVLFYVCCLVDARCPHYAH